MALRGKQKSYLRSQAHHLNPIFQVGKGGVNDAMIHQIGEALEKRELIKVSLLQNTDETPEEVAGILEQALKCQVVQTIGKILVVYKPSATDKYRKISLEVNKILWSVIWQWQSKKRTEHWPLWKKKKVKRLFANKLAC